MKNLTSALTITSILFSIPVGLFVLILTHPGKYKQCLNSNITSGFDESLRNYHPNKGE